MTTPRVTEIQRRLEAISADTFVHAPSDQDGPLAEVVALRPREGARGGPRAPRSRPLPRAVDPGDSAA